MVIREVGKRGLLELDFNNIAIKLGAQTEGCQGKWSELDEDDMRILYALLTRPVASIGSAAENSPTLGILASFCAAGIQWYNRKRDLGPVIDDRDADRPAPACR